MRPHQGLSGDSGLGFALPSWIKNIAGHLLQGTKVTVPSPVGPLSFDISDPKQLAALQKLVQGARLSNPNLEPVQPSGGAMSIVKPLAIGAGILLALKMLLGR